MSEGFCARAGPLFSVRISGAAPSAALMMRRRDSPLEPAGVSEASIWLLSGVSKRDPGSSRTVSPTTSLLYEIRPELYHFEYLITSDGRHSLPLDRVKCINHVEADGNPRRRSAATGLAIAVVPGAWTGRLTI